MSKRVWAGGCVVMWMALPAAAAAVTAAALVDEEDGRAFDLDVRVPVHAAWNLTAGAGRGESSVGGEDFSGTSLRAGADVQAGGFIAAASAERWRDSGQLRATVLRGELGWMTPAGLSLSALLVDRSLDVTYTATLAGQTRERDVAFEGTGVGVDLSWYGETWSAGARFVHYDYGRNVDRLRDVLSDADTTRFPRLQRLLLSMATRAAGAPDRELSLMLAHQWERHALVGDWLRQRDALTGTQSWSAGLTWSVELTPRWSLDTSAGVSDSDDLGSVPWAGVAITFVTGVTP